MSLEQALADATAAMKLLTAALTAASTTPAEKAATKGKDRPPVAATEPAATQATAEQPAAPAPKAEASAEKQVEAPKGLTVDERTTIVRRLATAGHRATIEALLAKFGVAKVAQLDAAALVDFDTQLVAADAATQAA